ncbi:four-carbon acid sugar kinase family protein [Octadecabacter sp.]|nr:four-carbon acid sugar kinase family protein [Octadecabacter sp.]MDC1500338.1 four-carbon acid sugar kinase family protein [Octadecabacter sp.]
MTTGEKPVLAWLGDDFTGAAAVMEVLAFAGLPAVLFLRPPTPERMADFPNMRGIGVASMARTFDPERMDAELPDLFEVLGQTGATLVQYKTCSTLDSAPHIGSIGKAMDIGSKTFATNTVPVMIAAPEMRRYQAFGQLFAGTDAGVFRLDRHPVMARHPVTPMGEADVALHLSAQTRMPMQCLNLEVLADPKRASTLIATARGGVTIDQMTHADVIAAGDILWNAGHRFVVGSQGIAYALVAYFQKTGALAASQATNGIGPAKRMAVVSGSVSPITADQIAWALDHGFAGIRLDVVQACDGDFAAEEIRVLSAAKAALERDQVPLIYTARGPDDPAVMRLRAAAGDNLAQINDEIGAALGRILTQLADQSGLDRVVVSGGDTSGHVCGALEIDALIAAAPTIPGAAICNAHGGTWPLTLALKGGQMGSRDYFGWVLKGGGHR